MRKPYSGRGRPDQRRDAPGQGPRPPRRTDATEERGSRAGSGKPSRPRLGGPTSAATKAAPAKRDGRRPRGAVGGKVVDGAPPRSPREPAATDHATRDPARKSPRRVVPAARARTGPEAAAGAGPTEPMRIAKAMARAGLCSRRDAERWIAEGRVSVNGQVLSSPARDVTATDRILVDGNPLPAAEGVRLWRYHKPRGCVTTHRDPEGRPTVFDQLPEDLPRVISIGRLDFNTEGLLLLTNDGTLARHLELPATGWLRRYRVRAHGRVSQAELDKLKDGIEIEGVRYGPIEATLDTVQGANSWLTLGLREGKNREVRNILGFLGLDVNRLIRLSYGPFQLLDLAPGAAEPIRRRVLGEQLGPELAKTLGLDQLEADDPRINRPTRTPRGKPRET